MYPPTWSPDLSKGFCHWNFPGIRPVAIQWPENAFWVFGILVVSMFSPLEVISRHFGPQNWFLHQKNPRGQVLRSAKVNLSNILKLLYFFASGGHFSSFWTSKSDSTSQNYPQGQVLRSVQVFLSSNSLKISWCFWRQIHLYRPQNLSPGVFWGVGSDFEVRNDEKWPPEAKT